MFELSSEQFGRLSAKIYSQLGLQFDEKKNYFLQKRVEKRMELLGFDDPQKYLFMVCYADPDGVEMQALANLITTNETYMFREYEQLTAFADHCLPELLSAKESRGDHTLRIWSAGCASGEEAYTLAIILREVFPQAQFWDCEIVATDIDQNVLNHAAKFLRAFFGELDELDAPVMFRTISLHQIHSDQAINHAGDIAIGNHQFMRQFRHGQGCAGVLQL